MVYYIDKAISVITNLRNAASGAISTPITELRLLLPFYYKQMKIIPPYIIAGGIYIIVSYFSEIINRAKYILYLFAGLPDSTSFCSIRV